jgi:hypothetical protein
MFKVPAKPIGNFIVPALFREGHRKARLDCDEEGGEFFGKLLSKNGLTMEDVAKDAPEALLRSADPSLTIHTEKVVYTRVLELEKSAVDPFKKAVSKDPSFQTQWQAQHEALFNMLWPTPSGKLWLLYIGQTGHSLHLRHADARSSTYFDLMQILAENWHDERVQSLGFPIVSTAGLTQRLIDNIERGFILSVGLKRSGNRMLQGIASPLTLHPLLYDLAAKLVLPDINGTFTISNGIDKRY